MFNGLVCEASTLVCSSMERGIIKKYRLHEQPKPTPVPGTPEERMDMVWELTRELCSLSPTLDAERPLQRHITRLIKR